MSLIQRSYRAKGYAVDFLPVSLHAFSRDPEAYFSPCIYTQIETEENEADFKGSDSERDGTLDLSKITEVRLRRYQLIHQFTDKPNSPLVPKQVMPSLLLCSLVIPILNSRLLNPGMLRPIPVLSESLRPVVEQQLVSQGMEDLHLIVHHIVTLTMSRRLMRAFITQHA